MFAVSFTAWLLPNHIPCCIISKYIARSKYLFYIYIYDIYIICVNIYIYNMCYPRAPLYYIYIYPHHIPIISPSSLVKPSCLVYSISPFQDIKTVTGKLPSSGPSSPLKQPGRDAHGCVLVALPLLVHEPNCSCLMTSLIKQPI